MSEVNLYPAIAVDQLWDTDNGPSMLSRALDRSSDECTASQLKMMLMRGEMMLLGNGSLWAAVQVIDHPNKRVGHVYAVAGKNITVEVINQLKVIMANHGCTSITCAADCAAERLYDKLGFIGTYKIMESKI